MAKNIDAKLQNIQGVFSNSNDSILGRNGIFIIPEYQRAYNWKYDIQCDKLWQDIESFMENEKNDSYFFGSIIINKDSDQIIVIYGQQRLTTFMLLLKALLIRISDILPTLPNDEDSEIIKEALKNRQKEIINCLYSIDEDDVSLVIKGSKKLSELPIKYVNKSINEEYPEELRFVLQGQSFDEIESKVVKLRYKQKDNKYTNFFRNFKFFLQKLEAFGEGQINVIAKALLKECQVIVVVSYQTDEAIEIFNSLNSTGMPLADADILSAKLYSNYEVDKTGFNSSWSEIIKSTNSLGAQRISTIDDILNQYMYILRAKYGEKDTTLPGVRRYFTDIRKELLKTPAVFLSDMEKIIGIWQDAGSSSELVALKQILFKHNSNFKFFYATYMYFNANMPNAQKQEFAEALLKLFSILAIAEYGYSSSKFKIFLISLNMDIGAGASTDEIVKRVKDHIQKEFNRDDLYNTLINTDADNATIYLNEYLFARETGRVVSFDITNIEIEHIMPASGRNLSAVRANAGMNEDEFNLYANKLGNKILLEQQINGSISNDWFQVKKQTSVKDRLGYKDSIFPIAQSLISYPKDKWEKADIDTATQKAAQRIVDYIFG